MSSYDSDSDGSEPSKGRLEDASYQETESYHDYFNDHNEKPANNGRTRKPYFGDGRTHYSHHLGDEGQDSDDEKLTIDDDQRINQGPIGSPAISSSGSTSDDEFTPVPEKYDNAESPDREEDTAVDPTADDMPEDKVYYRNSFSDERSGSEEPPVQMQYKMDSKTFHADEYPEISRKRFSDDFSSEELLVKRHKMDLKKFQGAEEADEKPEYNKRSFDAPSCSEERPSKKPKYRIDRSKFQVSYVKEEPIALNNKGHKLMKKMGYVAGTGLGKHEQGRTEPVEASNQSGRRGLGAGPKSKSLRPGTIEWDPSREVVEVKESVTWLDGGHLEPLDDETLSHWKITGPKATTIDNMTDFCDADLLKEILNGKSVFDELTENELLRARSRSNPFETLKNAIFLNRAALKMANMDAAFDFMFTSPTYMEKNKDGPEQAPIPMVGPNDLLYFADVCAGPGGFSEYVLWRKKWRAKGIGFTLRGDCDFNLSKFAAGSSLTFEPYYGAKGDGDIYNPENIESLTEFVKNVTGNEGVHFMMADGGFSVDGQENIQELLSKQLYLCQFLVALSIVREQGHFVCKLFDLFSPFSAGLVYLMYRSFDQISLFKPNTSRPANSERYIVCKHKRGDCDPIRNYLFNINKQLFEMKPKSSKDITHVVPMSVLTEDGNFYDYLVDSNNSLGERQVINLLKIRSYYQDGKLLETRQPKLRMECLTRWGVPNHPRSTDRSTPEEVAGKIIHNFRDHLKVDIKRLVSDVVLHDAFKGVYDWQCFALGSTEPKFFLGVGSNIVYQWNQKRSSWDRMTECDVKLHPGTLVFGEVIFELQGEFNNQKRIRALHVIDAISIGFEDISKLPFHERISLLQLYEKAISKKTERSNFRVKIPFPMENAEDVFRRLTVRNSQSYKSQLVIEEKEYWYEPNAVLFVNTTNHPPWMKNFSKSKNSYYFFHIFDKQSFFEFDCKKKNVYSSPLESLNGAWLWAWEPGVGLKKERPFEGVLHKDVFLNHVKSLMR